MAAIYRHLYRDGLGITHCGEWKREVRERNMIAKRNAYIVQRKRETKVENS